MPGDSHRAKPVRLMVGACAVAAVLTFSACGASSSVVPTTSSVRGDLARHGIDLRASAVDGQGCVTMKPRATNSGAPRTYGEFSVVIAQRDSCNDAQATGSADADHLYWSHRGGQWVAHEKLENNLWLRMETPSQDLGDKQHALEKAAFHAFHTGT